MNKGDRITEEKVIKKLSLESFSSNANLPIHVDVEKDQVERELILKQLLFLRQDINDVKQIVLSQGGGSTENVNPSNSALFLPSSNQSDDSLTDSHGGRENIEDAGVYALNEDTIGEVSLDELEHEKDWLTVTIYDQVFKGRVEEIIPSNKYKL